MTASEPSPTYRADSAGCSAGREISTKRFEILRDWIAESLPVEDAILDGELVCLDRQGHSQFYDLLFRRRKPYFYAFDLVWLNGEDLRPLSLLERKAGLKAVIPPQPSYLLYLDHVEGRGIELFRRACDLDLEGIVAKWSQGPYSTDPKKTSWVKIKNPTYSQAEGRADLFHPAEKSLAAR